jgi:hypothetical protein
VRANAQQVTISYGFGRECKQIYKWAKSYSPSLPALFSLNKFPSRMYRRQRPQRPKGKQLLRKHGELIERTFAHCYDTGSMRRTHLRKHNNILKRADRNASDMLG